MPSMPSLTPYSAMHSETVDPQPEVLQPEPAPQPKRSRGYVGLLAPIGLPIGLAASITGAAITTHSQYVEEASGIPVLVSTVESPDVPVIMAQSLGIPSGLWIDLESAESGKNNPTCHTDAQLQCSTRLGITFIAIDDGLSDTMPSPWREVFATKSANRVDSFAISTHEVTRAQFLGLMKNINTLTEQKELIAYFDEHSGSEPAVVTYEEAVEFCLRLSEKDSANYRLPTEKEWECACGLSNCWFGSDCPAFTEASGVGATRGPVWEWSDGNELHRRKGIRTSQSRAKKSQQVHVHLATADAGTGHEPPPPGRFRIVREPVTLSPGSFLQTGRFLR